MSTTLSQSDTSFFKAFGASRAAAAFRQRYDDPEFLSSIEKPFEWVDPAEVCFFPFVLIRPKGTKNSMFFGATLIIVECLSSTLLVHLPSLTS